MSNMKYFPDEDIIYIKISDGEESNSVEISPNITAELDKKNEIIGIEILKASNYIRDNILESVQAKILKSI